MCRMLLQMTCSFITTSPERKLGNSRAEVGGADQTGIYQATLSRTTLTSQGEMILSDPCDSGLTDVVQPFIVGAKNTPQNKMPGTFDYWKYPAGATPS